jgi:hypothetical protein
VSIWIVWTWEKPTFAAAAPFHYVGTAEIRPGLRQSRSARTPRYAETLFGPGSGIEQ